LNQEIKKISSEERIRFNKLLTI